MFFYLKSKSTVIADLYREGRGGMDNWKKIIIEKKKLLIVGILFFQMLIILSFFGMWIINESEKKTDDQLEPNLLSESPLSFSPEIAQNKELEVQEVISQKWVVDIKGEVSKPGIYEVESNMRVDHVIQLAGGLTTDADIRNLNLALRVQDQMMITIYSVKEEEENVAEIDSNIQIPLLKEESNGEININTADSNELQQLNGIGEKKAEKIIAYREENGSFKNIEELMNVNGIGEKTFEALKDEVFVSQ